MLENVGDGMESARAEIERDLKACFAKQPLRRRDSLVRDLLRVERHYWSPIKLQEARDKSWFRILRGFPIEFAGTVCDAYDLYFGRSRRPRPGWSMLAITIAILTLEAVRDADQRKHERKHAPDPPNQPHHEGDPMVIFIPRRKPFKLRRGFGRIESPINRFVYLRVSCAIQRAGRQPPSKRAVFDVLRKAAKPPRSRGLRS
jgi:hypothetical protein